MLIIGGYLLSFFSIRPFWRMVEAAAEVLYLANVPESIILFTLLRFSDGIANQFFQFIREDRFD
jgi:hypothetical protein